MEKIIKYYVQTWVPAFNEEGLIKDCSHDEYQKALEEMKHMELLQPENKYQIITVTLKTPNKKEHE